MVVLKDLIIVKEPAIKRIMQWNVAPLTEKTWILWCQYIPVGHPVCRVDITNTTLFFPNFCFENRKRVSVGVCFVTFVTEHPNISNNNDVFAVALVAIKILATNP